MCVCARVYDTKSFKNFKVYVIGKRLELVKVHVNQYECPAMNMFLILVEICCASFPTSLPILGCFDPPCILLLRL